MTASELKRWMKENGKTVEDVAAAIHVSYRTVARFLKKERKTHKFIVEAMAQLILGK